METPFQNNIMTSPLGVFLFSVCIISVSKTYVYLISGILPISPLFKSGHFVMK